MNSITNIDRSSLLPHIRLMVDDLISMTSNIIIKKNDSAKKYETDRSVILSGYYMSIIDGEDTLNTYDKLSETVLKSLTEWQLYGNDNNYFPDIKYTDTKIKMKNNLETCYIGTELPDNSFGNLYDGFILRRKTNIVKIQIYKLTDIYSYKPVPEDELSNITEDDLKAVNDNGMAIYYYSYNGSKEFKPISTLLNRYSLTETGKYLYDMSAKGVYIDLSEYEYYLKVRSISDYDVINILNGEMYVPTRLNDRVLQGMREYVIKNYVDPDKSPENEFSIKRYFGEDNIYYRTLNGLPNKDMMEDQPRIDRKLINPDYDGDEPNPYLYDLTDNEVEIIKSNGILDNYRTQYPDVLYLNFLGYDRIDVMDARRADNFDILRMGTYKSKIHKEKFIESYRIAKDFIISRYYHPEIFGGETYYTDFMCYTIVTQAMCQCVADNGDILLKDLYVDEETVRLKLQSYGLDCFNDIPLRYRKNIAKYIELLIMNKGTDNIYEYLIDLFEFDNIEIYKYFYRRLKDENGDIKLTMSQVPVDSDKFINEIIDDINKASYDEITQNDIYWGTYGIPIRDMIKADADDADDYLKDIITNLPFNYMNSKYISINSIFNLNKLNFNASYLLCYLLELSKRNLKLLMKVDTIDKEQPLFMLLVLLFAIQAKRMRYDGNIQSDAVSVAYIMKFNLNDYFIKNGEKVNILDLYKNEYRDYYSRYQKHYNATNKETDSIIQLQIPTDITLDSISESYLFNSGLNGPYSRLLTERENAESMKEFMAYDELLKAISISKMNNEIFKLSKPQWVEIDNFICWNRVYDTNISNDILSKFIENGNRHGIVDGIMICKSGGYPEVSLGYSLDEYPDQYCIDTTTNYVYKKEWLIKENQSECKVCENNYLFIGNNKPQNSNVDLSEYSLPYFYDSTNNILYKRIDTALTYLMYLEYECPYLYNIIQPKLSEYKRNNSGEIIYNKYGKPVPDSSYYERLGDLYTSITTALEEVSTDENLRAIIDNTFTDIGLIGKYLKKVLNVFKSFEVDIASINIIYEIGDPQLNRVKIIDDLSSHSDETHYNHFHMLDILGIGEELKTNSTFEIHDELFIEECNESIEGQRLCDSRVEM